MANLYSNQKPYNVVVLAGLFVLISLKGNSAEEIVSSSFNFPKFTQGDASLTLQGDAKISADGFLALPNSPDGSFPTYWTTSRALYATPVTIWDSASGNVASFVTTFSFVLKDFKDYSPADGIVFFLAPSGTKIPSNSAGGYLGVTDNNRAFNQFVGLEIDTFLNEWDPSSIHVGIDVNSLISLKTLKFNRVSGSLVQVTIIYDSVAKTFTVAMAGQRVQPSTISQVVDLKAVLPEKVNVGFSATT